jgi:hypothetical protein
MLLITGHRLMVPEPVEGQNPVIIIDFFTGHRIKSGVTNLSFFIKIEL